MRSNSFFIFASSSSGLGPNCDVDGLPLGCLGVPGRGVPPREILEDPVVFPECGGLRELGGADIGRVDIWSGGRGFPLACGSTSSRFTGIPREMRCCRRIRERVQLGGLIGGRA